MRTFIAIDFSPEIIERIIKVIKYFRTQTTDNTLKWVAPHNLHLTLKFIGEIPDNQIEPIKDLITESLKDIKAFTIGVQSLGMYPNADKPRVLWLGIEGQETLTLIHDQINRALAHADIEPDRRSFSPHLTIARIRRGADKNTLQNIGKTFSKFRVDSLGTCLVESVHLYKSVLTPQGPIYTLLSTTSLDKV